MRKTAYSERLRIGVYGSWRDQGLSAEALAWGEGFGKAVGEANHVLITGGSGGMMLAARRGCRTAGGLNVGIVPADTETKWEDKRSLIDVVVSTGHGALARMPTIAHSVDVAFTLGGGAGSLVEMLLTYLQAKPVVAVDGLQKAGGPTVQRLLSHTELVNLRGRKIVRGFIDSKREPIVHPIYVCGKEIPPREVLAMGLDLGRRWQASGGASAELTPSDE